MIIIEVKGVGGKEVKDVEKLDALEDKPEFKSRLNWKYQPKLCLKLQLQLQLLRICLKLHLKLLLKLRLLHHLKLRLLHLHPLLHPNLNLKLYLNHVVCLSSFIFLFKLISLRFSVSCIVILVGAGLITKIILLFPA